MITEKPKKEKISAKKVAVSSILFVLFYLLLSIICNFKAILNGTLIDMLLTDTQRFLYLEIGLALLGVIAYLYFWFENASILIRTSRTVMVLCIILVSFAADYVIADLIGGVYARPVALAALLTLSLVGRKEAIFVNTFLCLTTFLSDTMTQAKMTNDIYASIVVAFVTGMLAIFTAQNLRSRVKTLLLGVLLMVPAFVTSVLLSEITVDSLRVSALFSATAGIGSVVLFTLLLPFFETIFNVVTNYRLYEITDHNAPLIKRLREEAPGTFNHSLVVSTLAEACATAIGVNPQLARAAAYYHDVGKLQHPEFFKENQTGANPHDNLDPELSTNIIREHAKCGKSMIAEERLPEILGDVAQQHHGTLPIRFFYGKAAKLTDGHLDIRKFCYYGPVPATKVAAIIMICDAAEAIYRTLADRSREAVDAAVKKVIEERLDFDQFNECPITMAELYVLRKTIVENISMVYHERVAYPKFKISQQMLEEHEQVGGEAQ